MSSPKSPLKDAKKSAYSVVSKSDLISVNLPQFPKNTTQVARKKWLQDYEKVHNELLQHHIGLSSEQVQQLQEHYVQIQPHTTEIISLRQLPDDWEERQQEEDIKLEIANENHRKVLPRRKMVSFRNRNGIHSDVFNSCQSNDRRSSFSINRSYSPGPLEGNAAGRSCSTDIYHPGNITVGGLSQASDATAPRFMTSNKGFRSKSTDRSLTKSPLRNGFFHIATSIGSQSDNKHQLPERFKVNGAFTIHQQQSNSSNNISSASSPFPFTKTSTIDECVGIISNLVSPPPQYCSQVGRIKMDNIDLSWIIHQGGSDRPSGNLSLDTIRDDLLTTSSSDQRVTAINSPRSVIVMLRNGVSVKHLQIVPLEKIKSDDYKIGHNLVSSSLALGPGSGTHNHFLTLTDSERTSKSAIRRNQSQQDVNNDRALNNGIKSISGNLLDQVTSDSLRGQLDMQAYHHIEDRRRNLLSALREEYHTLCRNVPLNDLINRVACYHKLSNLKETFSTTEGKVEFKSTKKTKHFAEDDQNDMRVSDNSRLEKRKNKLERLLHISLDEISKKEEKTIELIKKEMELEEKNLRVKIINEERAQHAQRETVRKHQETLIRQKYLRYEAEQSQEEYNQNLQERRSELEIKYNKNRERRAQHLDNIRRDGSVKLLKLKEKREKHRELKVQMTELRRKKLQEKEIKCKERMQLQRTLVAEQRALFQKKADMRREEAHRAAELEEEKVIEKVISKSKELERRLEEFHFMQKNKRYEQHIKDLEKKAHRQKIKDIAQSQLEERKNTFIDKQLNHEELMKNNNAAKLAHKLWNSQQEKLCYDDKRIFLERRAQASNFNMLLAMNSIDEKKRRAESVERQKENMIEVVIIERDKLNMQRRINADKLYQKSISRSFDR